MQKRNKHKQYRYWKVGWLGMIGIMVCFFWSWNSFAQTDAVNVEATVPAICGNGAIEGAEQCDNGLNNGNGTCSVTCTTINGNNGGAAAGAGAGAGPGGDVGGEDGNGNDAGEGDGAGDNGNDGGADNGDNGGNHNGGDVDGDNNEQIGETDENSGSGGEENGEMREIPREALLFWVKNKTIPLDISSNGTITTLFDAYITIGIREQSIGSNENIASISFIKNGVKKQFKYNQSEGRYYIETDIGGIGVHDATIEVVYISSKKSITKISFIGLGYGRIREAQTSAVIAQAEVAVFVRGNGETHPWEAAQFVQTNPFITGDNGSYGFIVPNGTYSITVKKEGYNEYNSPTIVVTNNTINREITLIKKTPPISEVLDENASLLENTKQVINNIKEKTVENILLAGQFVAKTGEFVQQIADNPKVEELTQTVVVPTAIGVSVAAVAPSLWSILFPLLRFLFLQPLLVIGRKKRESWGVVYNSLTKLPIDLAMVRLIDANTKKVLQSRVTDKQGRYLFTLEPGQYQIEVQKPGFSFPTALLKSIKTDGSKVDIYHGENIAVADSDTDITPNVPIDPAGETKTPKRIIWEKRMRIGQQAISIVGIIATAVSLYIKPSWIIVGFLFLHTVLLFGFLRYIKPKKPKQWGIVYDENTKKPIGKAVARLFTKQYNKLVATQVTDNQGRYAFLVGPNDYYVKYEKIGYAENASTEIKIQQEKDGIITSDVAMKKK